MANGLDVLGLDLQSAAHSRIKRKRPSITLSEQNFVAPPVHIRDQKLPGLDTPKFALPSSHTVHSSEAFPRFHSGLFVRGASAAQRELYLSQTFRPVLRHR